MPAPETTPPAAAAAEPRNFAFIDALRGCAALLVVYFHLHIHTFHHFPTVPIPPGSLTYWFILGAFDLGKYAVAVFFLVSGFLIPSTLAGRGATLRKYVLHRLFRLYPAYWAAILLWVLLEWLGGRYSFANAPQVRQTLVNFTMFQRFVGVQDVIGAFWTLQIEIIFYILCGVLFTAGRLTRRREVVVGALALGLLTAVVRRATGKELPVALFLALALMFLGDMLRAAGRGDETAARQVRSTFVVVAVTLVPICYIGYVGEGGRYVLTYWAALATFGVALRARRYFEGRGPVQRVLNFLGAISYSVYLLHAPVGLALGAATLAATDSRILAFFATMASTIGAGYLSYRLVELPFLALGKKLAARPVKTAPAPAAVTAGGSGA